MLHATTRTPKTWVSKQPKRDTQIQLEDQLLLPACRKDQNAPPVLRPSHLAQQLDAIALYPE